MATALALAAVALVPRGAHAYTIANELSQGCHEEITSDALRAVRAQLSTAPALHASENDQALIDDLQFTPPSDESDLGGATLLIGVRDNDLQGRSSDDLAQLAAVHGNPDGQQEHCLRSQAEDEPTGSAAAIADCRAFILGKIQAALAGLDATGTPDPSKVTTVTVYLSLRGQVDAPLPTFYLEMGRAIHAIEDSFTHTYRTADEMKITVVLNWIDKVDGTLVESRDGPAHAKELDRCDDPDALRTTRHKLATLAATGALRATLDPTLTPDQKMTAAGAVLDTYLTYSPGCTYDNGWCDAPERAYADPAGCGCHIGGADSGVGALLAAGIAVMVGLGRRARRRQRTAMAAGALALLGVLAPRPALAQSATSSTTVPSGTPDGGVTTEKVVTTPSTTTTTVTTPTVAGAHAPPPPTVVPVPEPGPYDPNAIAWGAYLGGSASVDHPAVAGAAGLRMHASKSWTFGLDGEWNPWLAFNGSAVHAGAVNVYGTVIVRLPLAYESFNLRSSISVGTSYLVSNLYGAPSGSIGLFAAINPLGVEWKVSRSFLLIINPLGYAVPTPQLAGVPLLYGQYRFSLGLEVYLG
jgi:MYXO-CTERM domain-containing protein